MYKIKRDVRVLEDKLKKPITSKYIVRVLSAEVYSEPGLAHSAVNLVQLPWCPWS